MNQQNLFRNVKLAVAIILSVSFTTLTAQNSKFTVVIDAGHGGHDAGAVGKIAREKDINLTVVQNLGELIATNYNDVRVVYTRNTDKYLTLQERANIVNSNHADLFISIHTNAAPSSSAFGTETFTLGLAKSKGNLDVAMRENAVMLLEDDYKSKYKGFDPRSDDSYIMFEFMQDKYLDRSVSIASDIQKQFVTYAGRSDRGVRQAGFWVLYQSACPSVLVELGFISNSAEEKYLASTSGQKELAESIFKAFRNFKYELDKKSGKAVSSKGFSEVEAIKAEELGRDDKKQDGLEAPLKSKIASSKEAVVSVKEKAKIQSKADSTRKADANAKSKTSEVAAVIEPVNPTAKSTTETKSESAKKDSPKNDKPVTSTESKTTSNNETVVVADKAKQETKTEIHAVKTDSHVAKSDASTVTSTTKNGSAAKVLSPEKEKYVDMTAYAAVAEQPIYKLQLFASPRKLNSNAADFRGIRNADFFIENGIYKYTIGADVKYEVVAKLRKEMIEIFPESFVIAFLGKKKIGINEALKLTNKKK